MKIVITKAMIEAAVERMTLWNMVEDNLDYIAMSVIDGALEAGGHEVTYDSAPAERAR